MLDRNILYRSDCKVALDALYERGVRADLIYLDPPFNSSRIYSMIFNYGGVDAQQTAFHDMWSFNQRTERLYLDFKSELEQAELPQTFKQFMDAWMQILRDGDAKDRKLLNYLMYMTERLIRMRRILKPTGSIYFHCDPTASHYIKIVMDGIFGRDNFINEITWCYRTGGASKKRWSKKHDVLLMYTLQAQDFYFEAQKEKSYLTGQMRHSKKQKTNISDAGETYQDILFSKTLIRLYKDKRGYYTYSNCRDYWNIDAIGRSSKERLGYPTQKPLALLDRIVKASCPPEAQFLTHFVDVARLSKQHITTFANGSASTSVAMPLRKSKPEWPRVA